MIFPYHRNDLEGITEEYLNLNVEDVVHAKVPLLFVSFPSVKDPVWPQKFPGMYINMITL